MTAVRARCLPVIFGSSTAPPSGNSGTEAKITRFNEKIATLREEIQRLNGLNTLMMQSEDKQISLTDPGARSMATSGRGSGMFC
jgi:TolA-binding protein